MSPMRISYPKRPVTALALGDMGIVKTVFTIIHCIAIGAIFCSRGIADEIAILAPSRVHQIVAVDVAFRRTRRTRHLPRKLVDLSKKRF